MNDKTLDNCFFPKYVPKDLPWYEIEGFLTWYEQAKIGTLFRIHQ